MDPSETRCWLHNEDGTRVVVGVRGLLIGRSIDCDVILADPRTSAHHAMLRQGPQGIVLVPLGRNPTLVNGAPVLSTQALRDGDQLGFPGVTFDLAIEGRSRPKRRAWVAVRQGGTVLRRIGGTMRIGGAPEDDLTIQGWPEHAITLDVFDLALMVTFEKPGLLDDEAQEAEAVVQATSGAMIEFGGERLRVVAHRPSTDTTAVVEDSESEEPVDEAQLRFLPSKGGELVVDVGYETVEVQLSELRTRLLGVLMQPPHPYQPGEYIPDEEVLRGIWPRQTDKTGKDLNLLLHRLRGSLVRAGINPYRLVERTTGATRVRLGPRTRIGVT